MRLIAVAIIVTVWVIDQWSKVWAEATLSGGQTISLIGDLLTFQLHYNPGAAFSFATDATAIFSILSIVVLVGVVFFWIPRINQPLAVVIAGLLAGGVAGNLTDRLFRAPAVMHGHVVDFIRLQGFAIFNVADIAITSAAALMLIWAFLSERKAAAADEPDENAVVAESTGEDEESDDR